MEFSGRLGRDERAGLDSCRSQQGACGAAAGSLLVISGRLLGITRVMLHITGGKLHIWGVSLVFPGITRLLGSGYWEVDVRKVGIPVVSGH